MANKCLHFSGPGITDMGISHLALKKEDKGWDISRESNLGPYASKH